MTIQESLNQGKKILTENRIENASLVTRMLLSYVLNCSKEELIIKFDQELMQQQELEYFARYRKNI